MEDKNRKNPISSGSKWRHPMQDLFSSEPRSRPVSDGFRMNKKEVEGMQRIMETNQKYRPYDPYGKKKKI